MAEEGLASLSAVAALPLPSSEDPPPTPSMLDANGHISPQYVERLKEDHQVTAAGV